MSSRGITHQGRLYEFDISRFGGGTDDRVAAYAWALETGLISKFGKANVESNTASTGSTYITVYLNDEGDEFVIRVADHDARETCDAHLTLGIGYQDSDKETINTNGRGAKAIDMVIARITTKVLTS